MFELIRENQLNLMLLLCGGCLILILLLLNTRFLSKSRKGIIFFMELVAFLLLWFDRLSYLYAGDPSRTGYVMVRVSNFMVFFLTPAVILGLDLYVGDWLKEEGKLKVVPRRMRVVSILAVAGMILAVIAAFTGLYYTFDEHNQYHRGAGFLLAYLIPVLCPIIQYTVIRQYRRVFGRLVYLSMILYIVVPLLCGILQIFAYGISIVNMSMVAVSISMYVLMYLDLNDKMVHAHELEIRHMQRLFDQTATAFVSAVEKKDDFAKGNSVRIADYARRVAKQAGKSEEECDKVYYAALLHDVGLIGIPDKVIKNDSDPDKWDYEMMRKKPLIGMQILSSITEYPYLSEGAHFSHERYNGTGYPEGLKGKEIPEIARIIAVADAYVTMTTRKRYRDARPDFMAREAFVKGAGEEFDPVFAGIMVKLIDSETNEQPAEEIIEVEEEISCREYRENVSKGIVVDAEIRRITFTGTPLSGEQSAFSAPSLILFDSYDRRTHNEEKSIREYGYLEYGELWFDGHCVTTAARNIKERRIEETGTRKEHPDAARYEILAGRVGDHLKLIMRSGDLAKEVIVALPNSTNSAYIGLTGENCRISDISVESTGDQIADGDIPRIAQPLSYIDHLESDLKNVQIDQWRSAATEGVEVRGRLVIGFHTMSLPGASLIWHCPYIVLFTSDDGRVGGANYQEYQMVKLNGEDDGNDKPCRNRFLMKKLPEFPGWDRWKEINKEGMECVVSVERKGNQITIQSVNLGISVESISTGIPAGSKVYIAFTGDQVALTDIRIIRKT